MVDVALCLGTNSGDRKMNIEKMEAEVRRVLSPPIVLSALMETEPVEIEEEQPWFLNRIIYGRYKGNAFELLDACNAIEKKLGRKDKGTARPRTADIDILLFGREVITTRELTIPHRAITKRRFLLEGLYQIMPDAEIANTGGTVSEYYEAMTPELKMQRVRFLFSNGD